MPLRIITIPCLTDNYAYLIHETNTGQVAVVDVPDAEPILAALKDLNWPLHQILITHHHYDHIDGVEKLQAKTGAKVIGARADKHRLPKLDLELADNETFKLGHETCTAIDVSGHTIGHIAFWFKDQQAVFSADSLMALGCGRLFEGDFASMWNTLLKFKEMSDDTHVYSGHEYTLSNANFALTIEPNNKTLQDRHIDIKKKRAQNIPTVPSTIGLEKATNPFLRADNAQVKIELGMENASNVDVFAEIRTQKDNF